ncbi:MAG: hypothetical protein HQK51_09715 [Oligoflexia bacterium]|nr:hypothetical protein [Oligoflexia bacterium]
MFKIISLALVLVLSINVAMAGVFLESYLGYALNGKVEKKESATATASKWKYSSLGYGGRLGLQLKGFILGGSYEMMSYKWKGVDPKTTGINDEDQKLDGTTYGGFLGYVFNMGLVLRGGYVYHEMKKKDDKGPYDSSDKYIGYGIAGALGLVILKNLAFYVEYRKYVDETIKIGGTKYKLDDGRKVDMSDIFVSLAIPIGGPSKGGK